MVQTHGFYQAYYSCFAHSLLLVPSADKAKKNIAKLFAHAVFLYMQALGMKLLRRTDRPEQKVKYFYIILIFF